MRRWIAFPALIALAACTDLSKYTAEGQNLVAQFGPQIAALLKDNDGLLARVKSLPTTFPGVAELAVKIVANQTKIAEMKALVEAFPSKLADAVKSGKEADVTALLAGFKKDVTDGLAAAGASVKALAGELRPLESSVAERAAAAAFERKLPSGYVLRGSSGGVEAMLVSYIEQPSQPAGKDAWFDFDRLLFKTGSSDLDMEKSKEQLVNVAEILKTYPNVQLKVGGYTDNTGSAAANRKLSEARASSVVAQLVGMGIAPARLVSEGYGSAHPVCPANDTEECRAKNRRISLRPTAK
jgi:outer membrane protein OmpA-like peptidoglycan-associated protein